MTSPPTDPPGDGVTTGIDPAIYRYIFEHSHEGICVCQDGKVVFANPAFTGMTGYTEEELYSQPLLAIVDPRDHAYVIEQFTRRLAGAEDGSRYAFRGVRKGGEVRWLLMSAIRILWRGRPAALDFVADITDLREAQEREYQERLHARSLEAQRLESLGILAGGIAHDFNNLLNVILGFAVLAKGEAADGQDTSESMEEILAACERAKGLIRQILAFASRLPADTGPVSLAPVVEETLKFIDATSPAPIAVTRSIEADPTVLADRSMLHQLMMNLCTNAVLAMGEGPGELKVTLAPSVEEGDTCGHVLIEVSDDGCGMEAEVMERIFEPFYTRRAKGGGTGMGLSVVHGIVRSLGGSITCESAPGAGATFRVRIPVTDREPVEAGATLPLSEDRLGGSEHILHVDDEPSLIRLYARALSRLGYRVTSLTDPEKALEAFEAAPDSFDAVLVDLSMPGMSGEELTARIRGTRGGVPVVAYSGNSHHFTQERIAEAGWAALMNKPVSPLEFAARLRELLP